MSTLSVASRSMPIDNSAEGFLQAHPLPTWLLDAQTLSVLFANEAAAAFANTNGHRFTDLLTEESKAVFEKAVAQGDPLAALNGGYRLLEAGGNETSVTLHTASFIRTEQLLYQVAAVPAAVYAVRKNPRAEARLRMLASLVEQTSDVLTAADIHYRPITWNKAAEITYGFKAEEVIGKDLGKFIELTYDGASRDDVRRLIAERGEWRGEATFVRPADGRKITLLMNFKSLQDGEGTQLGYLISAIDISGRKEAESMLVESENRFREIADCSPVMIWMADAAGITYYTNKKWLAFTGKDICGDPQGWQNLVHPDDRDRAVRQYKEAVAQKAQATITYRLRTVDGAYCWVHDVSAPRFVADGSFVGYIGSVVDMQETKQKEEQLLYQATVLENVSDIIVTTGLDFKVRAWNKSATHYYGVTEGEAIGKSMAELVSFQYQDTNTDEARRTLMANGVWRGEVFIVGANGEKQYFLHTVQYVFDEHGNKIGFLAVGRDITQRKKMEEQLAKSEKFYRTLIADSLDGMILVDEGGTISFASPSVKNVLDFDVEELIGRNCFEFIHKDDMTLAARSLEREVNESPEVRFISVRLLKKSGEWLWCMVRGNNMLRNKQIGSIAIYFHDDTPRRKAGEALRQSEKRFRSLIRELQIGVLLQDVQGNILISNNTMERLFGMPEQELIGKQIWALYPDVIHEDGTPFLPEERPSYKAIQTKKLVRDVLMGVWHPQRRTYIWLIINVDPILDEEGTLLHVICSFTDITERKLLERALLTKQLSHQRQLTQATIDGQENERVEIGKELHDNIGQQLTTIKLFLDLAKSTADDNTNEMVSLALKGISDVINEIRAISRALVPSTLKDLGLVESIHELCDSITRTQLMAIDFTSGDFDETPLQENQKLTLFRILQEQLNNIVKHADAKRIVISLKSFKGNISLHVQDDGCGFDPQKIKKGLGFLNIRNRVELLGGSSEVVSHPGSGCLLKVSLPAAPVLVE